MGTDKMLYDELAIVIYKMTNDYDNMVIYSYEGEDGCASLEYHDEYHNHPETLNEWLNDNGYSRFEYIGNGSYCMVLKDKLRNLAFKISTVETDNAPKYWEFCIDNPTIEYLPTILDKNKIELESPQFEKYVNWCTQPIYHESETYKDCLNNFKGNMHDVALHEFPELLEWSTANNLTLDLHIGNVMENSDGQYIVIDAVSVELD